MFGSQDEEGFDSGGAQYLLPLLAVGRFHLELIVEELQCPARNVNPPITKIVLIFEIIEYKLNW